MKIGLINLAVIVVYFASMMILGLSCSRKQKSTEQYFLGGRNFSGWVLGISLLGALISSITFIAGPADTFKTAWLRLVPQLMIPIGAVIVARYVMPFFLRGTVTSAYDYLNRRFGRLFSVYAALLYVLGQQVRTSTILYLLAILLQSITGFSFVACLLCMGAVTAIYTSKGGFTAVIWTDVVQTIILILGALLCIGVIVWELPGGLGEIFSVAFAHHKLSFWDAVPPDGALAPVQWSVSLTEKSVLLLMVVGLFGFIGSTLDQANVQRWTAARSRTAARNSILILGFGALPIWIAFKFIGTSLYAYYQAFPDPLAEAILNGTAKAEEILPHFIIHTLPVGIGGLVISGALAAAMSTLSTCINSSAMVCVGDLYRPVLQNERSDKHYLRVGKASAWTLSVIMIGGALLVYRASASTLADLILMAGGILGGTVPAVFLLGMFTRRANLPGTLVGLVASTLFLAWSSFSEMGLLADSWRCPIHIYYSGLVGNLIAFVIGYGCSLAFRAKPRPLANLTVWDLTRESTPESQ